MANKTMKRCSMSLTTREMHTHTHKDGNNQKDRTASVAKDVAKGALLWECRTGIEARRSSIVVPQIQNRNYCSSRKH